MGETKINSFVKTGVFDFVLKHKVISAFVAIFIIVVVSGGVAFGMSEAAGANNQNQNEAATENIDATTTQQQDTHTDTAANIGTPTTSAPATNVDGSKLIPIQQGATTKVNFLPVYNGNTPPCNFYKKENNGSFTIISNITSMGSLGQKIQEVGPENVYTDGHGQTFYGCYDTNWSKAFYDKKIEENSLKSINDNKIIPTKRISYNRVYSFKENFKDQLISQGLPVSSIYSDKGSDGNPSNWDYHNESTPTINGVSVHTFWYAYNNNKVNKLLTPNSSRLWSSCALHERSSNSGILEYVDINNEMKWNINYDFRNDTGAIILAQKMTKYKVTFNGNGHGANIPQDQLFMDSHIVNQPSDPTDPNYDFLGWYKESECKNHWDFNRDVLTADTTLYAKWIPKPDPSKLVPIQQGTTTKVNFLPVYDGNTPPCNFYKKQSDGSFTLIRNITSMGSLGQKIQEVGPENVYTDGRGQTFYGCYDTKWTNAFEDDHSWRGDHRRYDFKQSFKDQLKSQGLPLTNVYTNKDSSGNNPSNWDRHDDYTPTLNGVSVHTFWYAYKYNNVNLLSPNSWRLWTSCINTTGYDTVWEYVHTGNEMKWSKNYYFRDEYRSADVGSVILTQKMGL